MTTPHKTDHDVERRQRKIDFDVLAPLTIIGVIVSVVAMAVAIGSMNQVSSAEPAVAKAAPAASGDSGGESADERSVEGPADFTMKPYDPKTAPVKPGPKTFNLTATEKNIKVGDKTYRMWTFNNSVPGPTLRAVVGDRITIKIDNEKSSKFLHSVDYHASRITLGGGHVQVEPGKAGEFTFDLEYPGVFMYHCATAPVLQHIGMGMYGMIIVQPKEGFQPEMPEYAFTQSELYDSQEGIDTKAPAAMSFNGIPNQYLNDPIKLPADSDIRLFVLNAGPSELSSFHVVGTIFDRVYEDGNPRNVSYGRQALAMPASGGGVFEMTLKGEGKFPFLTHQFNHAAKGAIGLFLTGDGLPGPGSADDPSANGHH